MIRNNGFYCSTEIELFVSKMWQNEDCEAVEWISCEAMESLLSQNIGNIHEKYINRVDPV